MSNNWKLYMSWHILHLHYVCEDINNVDVELHDTIHCFLNLQIAECSVITLYQVL